MMRVTQRAWDRAMWSLCVLFVGIGVMASWGCGGDIELGYGPEPETTQHDVTVGDHQMGWISNNAIGSGNPRCADPHTAAQVCNLPGTKNMTVKAISGWSATQLTDVNALIDGWITRFDEDYDDGGWSASRITGSGPVLRIDNVDDNPATNKNSIHTYAFAFPGAATTLTESTDQPGVWQKFGNVTCKIDRNNITRDFTAVQVPIVLSHAIDYCMWKGFGQGSSSVSTTKSYAIAVTPSATKSETISATVACELNSYVATGGAYGPLFCLDTTTCPCMGLTDN